MLTCGHPNTRKNIRRRKTKRICRICEAARLRKLRTAWTAKYGTKAQIEARWLADLPSICDDADRLASR